jgi:hypothetical protein
LSKYVTWKEPKLYKAKDKWFVEYQFRIPEELRYRYKGAKWKGFRVYEDINRHKTDEYANLLLTAVCFALKQGFNPFEQAKEAIVEFRQQTQQQDAASEKTWTCIEAFNYFIQEWEQRGLEDATLSTTGEQKNKRHECHARSW